MNFSPDAMYAAIRRCVWRLPWASYYGDMEDAVQDCALHLWRYHHLYDPTRGAYASWVWMQCRTAMLLGLRRGSNAGSFRLIRDYAAPHARFHAPPKRRPMRERGYEPPLDDAEAARVCVGLCRRPDIAEGIMQGKSFAEMAREWGVTRQAVRDAWKRDAQRIRNAVSPVRVGGVSTSC